MAFPIVRQHDAMQCGAASLAMICEYYSHKKFSLDEIEDICGASRRGVSMLAVSEAARILGFKTRGCRLSLESLKSVPLPCILHWNGNHFVVLYKISRGKRFHIADPGRGDICYSQSEFIGKWYENDTNGKDKREGIALLFEPTPDFEKITCAGHDERHSLKFILGYIGRFRYHLLKIIIALAIGSGLQLLMPFLTQAVVDRGINARDIGIIWLILIGELMIVAGSTFTDFIRRRLLLKVSMRVNIALLSDFFIKLLRLPMDFFEKKLIGDMIQRMEDHWRVQTFLTNQFLGIIFATISFIIYGTVLCMYSPFIFMIFFAGSAVYGFWITIFLKRRKKLDYEMFDCRTDNQNRTIQFLTFMQEIKLQSCEHRRLEEWEKCQHNLFGIQLQNMNLQQTQEAGSVFINELKNIFITVSAAMAVINANLSLGAMLAIQYIVGQLNSPVNQIMGFVYAIQDVKISLERINEIHNTRNEEERDSEHLDRFETDNREISISSLDFKYDIHSPKYTLKDISVNIPSHKTTAIVGASGSGKSTLIKIILGYYRPLAGRIMIGDNPLGRYNLRWLRGKCGVVMQDGAIFSESIARNIAVDDNDIDTDRMMYAAEVANVSEFAENLPQGYNTVIGNEGTGISQGQKQRILIARAIYKNPDFIFLDEATNSLDTENEKNIVERLNKEFEGKTVIIVAHRLSTVMNADQIIVIDKGRVAECGNHRSLTDKKGIYYNLVKNQLELGN